MNTQRRGPPYRFQAQGTQWATPRPTAPWWWPYRGEIVGTAALIAGLVCAVVMAAIAVGVV